MIGIVKAKGDSICAKIGFKVLKFLAYAEIKDHKLILKGKEYPANGTEIFISVDESDIEKETMTALVLKNFSVMESLEDVNKGKLVHESNVSHMSRFASNYSGFFRQYYTLRNYESMDVIDLKNINSIETTQPNDVLNLDLPVFKITEIQADYIGLGFDLEIFKTDGHEDCYYMGIPNSWHRIQRDGDTIKLVIDVSDRSPKTDLLFIKFNKDTAMAFLKRS